MPIAAALFLISGARFSVQEGRVILDKYEQAAGNLFIQPLLQQKDALEFVLKIEKELHLWMSFIISCSISHSMCPMPLSSGVPSCKMSRIYTQCSQHPYTP